MAKYQAEGRATMVSECGACIGGEIGILSTDAYNARQLSFMSRVLWLQSGCEQCRTKAELSTSHKTPG